MFTRRLCRILARARPAEVDNAVDPKDRWSNEGGAPSPRNPPTCHGESKSDQKKPENVYRSPEINQDKRTRRPSPPTSSEQSDAKVVGGFTPQTPRTTINQQRRNVATSPRPSSDEFQNATTFSTGPRTTLQNRLFNSIMRDHAHIRSLFRSYESTEGTTNRKPILNSIVRILSIHSATEEKVLYPAFKKIGFKDYQEKGRDDHQEVKNILDRVKDRDIDVQTDTELRAAIQEVEQHVQWEEQTALPQLQKKLSAGEIDELATEWDSQWKSAPTRPHPNAPSGGGVAQSAAGAVAGAIDSIRDKNVLFVDEDYVNAQQGQRN
jgi:hemerythrin superfamily protein